MEWIALKSRLVSEIAYDAEHEVLEVRLRTGAQRKYDGISPTIFENLRSAESPGFYYSYYIARAHDKPLSSHRLVGLPLRALRLMRLIAVTGFFLLPGSAFLH